MPRVNPEMLKLLEDDIDLVDLVRDADIQSAVSVPMKARGRVLGVLSLARSSGSAPYDEQDLTFISDVAHRMARMSTMRFSFDRHSRPSKEPRCWPKSPRCSPRR